ncbi:MAG: GNAT family N-acetyltransferase [Lachnospiraceae bacterium]|nr:GNAT family N-acetyltransferase [Lachnospiraceae bacterium]
MIERAMPKDAAIIAKMAVKMWENHTIDELTIKFEGILDAEDSAIFICFVDSQAIGFAQCQLRHDYVEGTESSPVGYLEGIFVEQEYRHKGYAKVLLSKCEEWAKEQGCLEFASDCELDNSNSFAFHMNMGFSEANRIICFIKSL